MEYNFREVEKEWRAYWTNNKTFKTEENPNKPKYYVLDMFPYPSGAGLHVGHPLGYIASDIMARFKRLKGFNVLHPMGYDAFGLPAEQYAIQTGQHPAITTEQNIKRYREQLDKIGFSFDWSRSVRTSDPSYYKWTQWIFIQLFNSWYNPRTNKAEKIEILLKIFETEGAHKITEESGAFIHPSFDLFSPTEWSTYDEKKRSAVLMNFRIAYLGEAFVNWCPALGTVLANDEVKDGVSERGGHPVERKLMKQWSMRITAYAQRLLDGLEKIDWSESLKESQRNWIGKSEGASLKFKVLTPNSSVLGQGDEDIEVFTTRPDTVFGVSFITLAPEHKLVDKITTPDSKAAIEAYKTFAKNRSERERMADVKKITGEFTGAYAEHPFTGAQIPIWIGDYVLAGYGTGAVMAVPAHDARDYAFAKHFSLPITEVVSGGDISKESYDAKSGKLINSDFLNGLEVKAAIARITAEIEKRELGKGKINYRLRDAVFGRQRYWGEPIPIYYKNGIPYALEEKDLPLELPQVDKFLPTEAGEPPLARASNWKYQDKYDYEHTTMPGWAGSSWYYLRYMDPHNTNELVSKQAADYWKNIDLYIGGSEHATGHLLYVRFWTKFLNDIGSIGIDEPAGKLINQGMIQGRSLKTCIVTDNYFKDDKLFYSFDFIQKECEKKKFDYNPGHNFPIEYADEKDRLYKSKLVELQTNELYFKESLPIDDIAWVKDENGNEYILLESEIEKMSKSKRNVVTPDSICEQYGADCLRLYEMFLGPLEQSKPWNTNGITGVSGFLKKLWRLFHDAQFNFLVTEEAPTKPELKTLHKTIKKIHDDIERYSFNTSVSNFMICVNELSELKCNKRAILEPLVILISPYAPHIAEELWKLLGHTESISYAQFPDYNEAHMEDASFAYPVSFNGKTKFKMELPLTMGIQEIEKEVMSSEEAKKYLEGKVPKKIIIVPKKIVNIVLP